NYHLTLLLTFPRIANLWNDRQAIRSPLLLPSTNIRVFFRKNVPRTGDSRFRVGRLCLWIIVDGEMPKGAPGSSASHKRRATCPNRQAYRTSAINRAGGSGVEKSSSRSSRRTPDSEKALLRPVGRARCAARLCPATNRGAESSRC